MSTHLFSIKVSSTNEYESWNSVVCILPFDPGPKLYNPPFMPRLSKSYSKAFFERVDVKEGNHASFVSVLACAAFSVFDSSAF